MHHAGHRDQAEEACVITPGRVLQAGITSGALASAAVGAINVLGTVIAASLMDKAGRKQLLTTSFAGEYR